MHRNVDIAVVGGGPAGLAAALEARKHSPEASILIIERDRSLGGILQQSCWPWAAANAPAAR